MYEIEFYETDKGDTPVFDFLERLSRKNKAKAIWEIEILSLKGIDLQQPYTKHISEELWELRIKFNSDISRIFYFIATKEKIVLLHGFIKKTNRTPIVHIAIAKKRLHDYKERHMK